jgi:hypothetical protein
MSAFNFTGAGFFKPFGRRPVSFNLWHTFSPIGDEYMLKQPYAQQN